MRQWAISIGINQYQSFQPLSYAQHDAQAIQQFLVDAVGVPAEQCVLLTETSPPLWEKSTYPDRDTIQNWLDFITQKCVQPGDVLWFFFSGYGMCQQGQDYLIPIAGNPSAVQGTALPMETIFRSLRRISDATVLVLLDVNRNESSFSYETVGNHTAHLASITGIPTILSCQPGQFSRETSALGHGFFTAALLESLHSPQGTTIAALDQMLSARLPALSEHYWRPIQQPVTVCPPEKRQQFLLPRAPQSTHAMGDRATSIEAAIAHSAAFLAMQVAGNAGNLHSATTPGNGSSGNGSYVNGNGQANGNGHANGNGLWAPSVTTAATAPTTGAYANATAGTIGNEVSKANGGGAGYTNGGAIASSGTSPDPGTALNSTSFGHGSTPALALQALQNGTGNHNPIDTAAQNYENGGTSSDRATTVPQPHSDSPEDPNDISDALFWRSVLRWGGLAVVGLILGVLLRNCASFTPKAPSTAQQPVTSGTTPSTTGQTGVGQVPLATKPSVKPGASTVPLVAPAGSSLPLKPIASTHLGASGASRLNVPANKPATTPSQPAQAPRPANSIKLAASSHLAKARAIATVNSNQASPYSDAIQEAKKVQPGQPDYPQAKQAIADWSGQILRIARQRGRQGRFDAAIVAARLIPQGQPARAEAKSAIERWCPALRTQRGVNPVQRRQAKSICRTGLG
ncbi:MAG: caspase family protein [Lyngbya sp. HA4199-MV5]|jgi:hypothetical protein|nr:caspase family protein [Lyngbya sp. HA4199-MV5]